MEPLLSICIPVYNCADFLGAALDSALDQLPGGVELIVFDGGSKDATPELMAKYCEASEAIRYHRATERGGIDADLASCVQLAKGEYCWLFSGDDVMRAGALARVLDAIRSKGDVYIGQHGNSTIDMQPLSVYPVLQPTERMSIEWSDRSERLEWFRRASNSEAFFSFMSGLVVKRATWNRGSLPLEFKGSCWGHVARFFALGQSGLRVTFVPEVWLDRRGGNDSFADRGTVNRYRIAIEGYHRLADVYFGHDSPEAFHIRRIIRGELGFMPFVFAHAACRRNPAVESEAQLASLHLQTYSDWSNVRIAAHRVGYEVASGAPLDVARAGLHKFPRLLQWLRR